MILLLGVSLILTGDDIEAFTVLGRGVVLRDDGTWVSTGRNGVFEVDRHGIDRPDDVPVDALLRAKVISVPDGDTLVVQLSDPPPGILPVEQVRLLGVDAGEIRDTANEREAAHAEAARERLRALTLGRTAHLAMERRWRGSFGRLLAYVYLSDGSFVNGTLLTEGKARLYRRTSCAFRSALQDAELVARRVEIGIWAQDLLATVEIADIMNSGYREYVELRNTTDRVIDLVGWRIQDDDDFSYFFTSDHGCPVKLTA